MEACTYIVPIIMIIICVITIISPKTMWDLSQGWQYKNPESVEPSEAGLMMARIGAVAGVIAAIFFIGWFANRPTGLPHP